MPGPPPGSNATRWTASRPTPSPEERVTDRVALAQIWPQLRPVHREVLAALAAHDDYGKAAAALGKSRKTFTTQVSQARRAFLDYGTRARHPPGLGIDRRPTTDIRHTVTYRAIVLRQRHRARRTARNDGQPPPPARRTGPPRADLGISSTELVRRYEQGQSIRRAAASLGSSYSAAQRRLQTEGAQLRPGGGQARRGSGTSSCDVGIQH